MKRKLNWIIGAIATVGAIVSLSCAGGSKSSSPGGAEKGAPNDANGDAGKVKAGKEGKAGKAAKGAEEGGPVMDDSLIDLQPPEPFLEYVPFKTKQGGFRDPMRPLISVQATPTPGPEQGNDDSGLPAERTMLPDWANLKGVVWDSVNPAKSIAVFVDKNDVEATLSGGEGEDILPADADSKDAVNIKTIWPTGVMLVYQGQEFSQRLPEDLGSGEDGDQKASGRHRSAKRPARRGGRR